MLITGAASGIGAACAVRFAREGSLIGLADINAEGLQRFTDSLDIAGDRIFSAPVDVGVEEEVDAFVAATAERFGRIDVVVNNAGVVVGGEIGALTTSQWRRCFAVDLDSVFFCCRAALPHLRKTRGCIVNTSSVSGLGGDYGLAAYNSAKAGMINLTRAMAVDYAAHGVRSNAVCPGLIATPAASGLTPDMLDQYQTLIPMQRPGSPDEAAAAICFLASTDASYITGTTLVVDGGLTALAWQGDVRPNNS